MGTGLAAVDRRPVLRADIFTVAPRGHYQHVEAVYGASPATRFIPAWSRVDPSETYRAMWNIQRAPGSVDAEVPIPIEERVSNNFTLRLPPG